MKISAIVLAGEGANKELLEKCLKSLTWCDELIQIKPDGKDQDFSKWRNEGAKKAKYEWLLYVDSDEEVTAKLREEIKHTIKTSESDTAAYAIPRKNILLGKEMRYGGWWPDYVVRLIRKDKFVKWEGKLHEQPKLKGNVEKLKEPFVHRSHRSLEEMVEKTNKWSEIEAELLFKSGHPPVTWWRMMSAAFREFWYRGVRKLGFLDGGVGVIEIVYQMFSRMITYAKLWEMQEKKK